MTGSLRNTIAVGIAGLLAAVPIHSLTSDDRFLAGFVLAVVLLQAVAALVRRFTGRTWPATLGQLVLLVGGVTLASALLTNSPPGAGRGLGGSVADTFQSALRHMREQAAPMDADDATLVVLVAAVGVLTILIDISFIAARSALLAALPLLGGYLAAASVFAEPLHPASLVAVCVGWLVLLGSRTVDHERRWPRGLTRQTGARLNARGFATLAIVVSATAIMASLLAGLLIPPTPRELWPEGTGTGTVQLSDPSIQLNENLRRPEDQPVLRYTSTAPGGVMLRSSALTAVDENGWHQVDMALQRGFPTRIPGVAGVQPTDTTQVSIGEFESNYLPVPYAPVSWEAPGDWNFDPASLTVLNVDRNVGPEVLRNLAFTVDSRNTEPTADQLRSAVAGTPPEGRVAIEVPQDVPQEIRDLALEITADADTDGRRAIALQDWLRDPARFTYTLDAPTGTGYQSLVNFLTRDFAGYCVHYSAAMSLMARVVGIPARVAVGFTPGTQQDDGSWLVTSHDMHAWPELYFSGLGWVRFEPTVAIGTEPGWTEPPPAPDETVPEPQTEPSPTIEAVPPAPDQEPNAPLDEQSGPGTGTPTIDMRWVLGTLGVILLLAAPGLVRLLQRRARLGSAPARQQVSAAWRELAASVIDLGLDWPASTPRQVAATGWGGLDAKGQAALERVALLVERLYYAPGLPAEVAVRADVELVTRQLRAGQSSWTRLQALVLPRSLVWRAAAPRTRGMAGAGAS